MACMALVSGDMVTNKVVELADVGQFAHEPRGPIPSWHKEPQRREEHPRELVVWQFTAVLLEFVHESLVGVVNHRALHRQLLRKSLRIVSAYFSHKPHATIHLVEVQCSEEGIELHESFVEVGSDEFQVRCLVARLASLTLTISVTVRRLFSLGRRLASLLLQTALLCLLLAFLMPLLLADGGSFR